MKTVLITGATRGLGLAIARALDANDDVALVLAVRDPKAAAAVTATLQRPARVVSLDLASLADVERFTAGWREPLHALVNNAGLQSAGAPAFTADGIEETLAVNWLAPLSLTIGLLPHLHGACVLGIGSGTHNPANRTATMFGFRGGRFTSLAALARGEGVGSARQQALDRYATSKLLVTAGAMELARRFPATTFATLDPGLMPGTGLARNASALERFAWATLLRALVPLLPDASTPARSAAAACTLLASPDLTSGEVYDFHARASRRVWPLARARELGAAVIDQSLELLAQRSARAA